MDVKLKYYAKIEAGKVTGLPTKRFREEVARAFEGKAIQLTVERKRKQRSPEQNRYYWGVLVNIVAHMLREYDPQIEITPEITHQYLKEKFLPLIQELNFVTIRTPGEEIELKPTTTNLTTSQFMDYIVLIQEWAASIFNYYIPDPNEWEFESLEKVDVDRSV